MRKLAAYLRRVHGRVIRIGREALRRLLARRGVTFQRTKTWKESRTPTDTKLDRPLGIRPTAGTVWAEQRHPQRLPATYHRTHGIRYFHGCYSVGDDTLWGVNRRRKGAANTLAALKSIRAARPDGAPIYVIMDNLSPTFSQLNAVSEPASAVRKASAGADAHSPQRPDQPGERMRPEQ